MLHIGGLQHILQLSDIIIRLLLASDSLTNAAANSTRLNSPLIKCSILHFYYEYNSGAKAPSTRLFGSYPGLSTASQAMVCLRRPKSDA